MNYEPLFNLWGGAMGIAVLIAIAVSAIGLMVAYVLQDERLKAWVKNELLQAFYSVCILALLVSIIFIADNVAKNAAMLDPQASVVCNDATNSGGLKNGNDCTSGAQCENNWCDGGRCVDKPPCHIALAENYLNVMFDNAYYMERELLLVGTWLTFWSNFSIGFNTLFETWGTVSIAPAAGLAGPAESVATAFEVTMKGMIGLRVQEIILSYIYQLLFPILLVVGVVLRTFFFTRRLGGLLMAIAISLYFIFPISYVMGGFVFFNFSGGTLDVTHFDQNSLQFPIGGLEGKSDEEITKMLNGYIFSIGGSNDIGKDPVQQNTLYVQLKSIGGCGDLVKAMEKNLSAVTYTTSGTTTAYVTAKDGTGATISVNGDKCELSCATTNPIGNVTPNGAAQDIYVSRMFTGQLNVCQNITQELYGQEVSQNGTLGKFGAWIKERWRYGYWRLLSDAMFKSEKGVVSLDWLMGDNGYLHNTGKLFVFTVIVPIFAFMITLASINIMSPLFGGDVEIAVISRLI